MRARQIGGPNRDDAPVLQRSRGRPRESWMKFDDPRKLYCGSLAYDLFTQVPVGP